MAAVDRAHGAADDFQPKTVYAGEAPVFLLEFGSIHQGTAVPELVAVDGTGAVFLLEADESGWTINPLPVAVEPVPPTDIASRPTLAVGDVRTDTGGEELLIETSDHVNLLVQEQPGQWVQEIVYDSSKFVGKTWGARLGDIDPQRPGLEPFILTEQGVFDVGQGYAAQDNAGTWTLEHVYLAEVGMDSAIGDTDPESPGHEIIVGTEMGPVYEITAQPGQPGLWPSRTLWDDFRNAPWVVKIADVLPDQPGNEILYGTRYSNSVLMSSIIDDRVVVEALFAGSAEPLPTPMIDIAVGDVDVDSPTLEVLAVDLSGRVYLIAHDGMRWHGEAIWQDPDGGLYAVAVADVLPDRPGMEIVVTGESGTITLLQRPTCTPADLDCDGAVSVGDLLILLGQWGACGDSDDCPGDLDDDHTVGVSDLLILLGDWT